MATTKKESTVLEEVVSNIRDEIKEKNDAQHLIYIASMNQKIDEYLSYVDACVADIEKYIKDNNVDDSINELADEITKEELTKLRNKYSPLSVGFSFNSSSLIYGSSVSTAQSLTGLPVYTT